MAVNPFELTNELYALAFQNLQMLINNFAASGHQNIIIPGIISNEKLLTKFLDILEYKPDLRFIWLRATRKVRDERRIARQRDDADNPEHFAFLDGLIPDAELQLPYGKYLAVDTSTMTSKAVLASILPFVDE